MNGHTQDARPLSAEETERLRLLLKALPDEDAAKQAAQLFQTYRALGQVGKLFIGVLKIIAVVAAGVIAWLQLRGLWFGKGGGQ